MTIMEKKPQHTNSGIMQKLVVYSNEGGAIIGSGWVIHTPFKTYTPTLIALDGTPLEEGWYTLQVVGEGFPVVLNRSIH